MTVPAEKNTRAWQPLTPGGVAAFAQARFVRLLIVEIVVASFVAVTLVWLVYSTWFPTIASAINALPEQGRIASGQLEWHGPSVAPLAESPFLAFTVDVNHAGTGRTPAHLQLEFAQFDCRVYSLFGFTSLEYPTGRSLPFNRPALVPWWGAWAPLLLAGVAGATLLSLLLIWAFLALCYCLPAWLIAFFADRRSVWREAAAVRCGAHAWSPAHGWQHHCLWSRRSPPHRPARALRRPRVGGLGLPVYDPFFCPRRSAPSGEANPFSQAPSEPSAPSSP